MKKMLFSLLAAITLIAITNPATAQSKIKGTTDVGQFFKFFCKNIKIKPGDISGLGNALRNLRNSMPGLEFGLNNLKIQINPPSNCLNGMLNFGQLFPSLPNLDLASCFSNLDFKPNFVAPQINPQCIANMMPKLGALPTFDRNKFNSALACLGNTASISNIDLPNIATVLGDILGGIKGVTGALLGLLPKFELGLGSPDFISAIRWTNGFCGKVNNGQINLNALSTAKILKKR